MVKKKSSAQCSAAGKALAACRWGSKKKKAGGKKPKARKPKAPVRKSRRLAGQEPVRGPEPKKARKKAQKAGPKRTAASKKIEEILVPGLNPKKGDMQSFIEAQRRLYA